MMAQIENCRCIFLNSHPHPRNNKDICYPFYNLFMTKKVNGVCMTNILTTKDGSVSIHSAINIPIHFPTHTRTEIRTENTQMH